MDADLNGMSKNIRFRYTSPAYLALANKQIDYFEIWEKITHQKLN